MKKSSLQWKMISFLYASIIFLNENLAILNDLGLSEKTERIIKVTGAAIYFTLTFWFFKPTNSETT